MLCHPLLFDCLNKNCQKRDRGSFLSSQKEVNETDFFLKVKLQGALSSTRSNL